MHLFIYTLAWKKELHQNSYTNFISDVINIGFLQIWHFDVTGWVGLDFGFILMQIVGGFEIWMTPYTGILTLAKLKYFMFKGLSTKALWSFTVANNKRRHPEHGIRNLQRLTRKTYRKLWLRYEFLITLMKLRLGFLCWSVLKFWNKSDLIHKF